jgi:hypothetical protein
VREKYEATKVLEVGDKVKKLGRTHKWLLSLASRSSEMHEQLKHDIFARTALFFSSLELQCQ